MEVVLSEQPGAAERENVGVDTSSFHVAPEFARSPLRLWQVGGALDRGKDSGIVDDQPGESERPVRLARIGS